MKERVNIVKFEEKKLDKIFEENIESFGLNERLKKAKSVFIKPNLVTDVKEYIAEGANTDVRVIESLLKYLSKYPELNVYVGESETGTKIKGRKLEIALDLMGVTKLKEKYNFEIVNLTYDEQILVNIPDAKKVKEIKMGKKLMDADLIFDLPKIKTHKYATITCALKNMFGSIPDPLRIMYHENIHQVLADLNRLFANKLFVVTDGIVGMEGAGPLYGTKVQLNTLLFSNNALANDVIAAKIMGFDPKKVLHLNLTNAWMNLDYDNIYLGGNEKLRNIKRKFEPAHKNLFIQIEGKLMQFRPIIKIIFNDWVRKNITFRFNKTLVKLRGGSYSWYIEEKINKKNSFMNSIKNMVLLAVSKIFRNLPGNTIINVIPKKLSLLLKNTKMDSTFLAEKTGILWSTFGFPDLITRHMMFSGIYQADVLGAIKKFTKSGDVVFDIGAHHGLMSIIASISVGENGKVVAFDPNPAMKKFVKKHWELNNVKNAKLEEIGLMDAEGVLTFYPQKGVVTWNSSFIRDFVDPTKEAEGVDVKVTTLDKYVEESKIIPSLIKIDTEGTEIHILKGSLETLKKYHPILIMEFNPSAAEKAGTTLENITDELISFGYQLYVPGESWGKSYDLENLEKYDIQKHSLGKDLVNVICIKK